MSAATVILIRMKRYIRTFRNAGATSSDKAILPLEYGIPNNFILRKLVRQQILVPVANERYYLDEAQAAFVQKRRRTLLLILVGLILIGFLVSYLLQ